MKIRSMHVHPIAIADAPLRNSVGIHEPYVNRIVVELVGENGESGFGEASYSTRLFETLESLAGEIAGYDSMNVSRFFHDVLRSRMSMTGGLGTELGVRNRDLTPAQENSLILRAYSPVEVAALDLTGKDLGVPVAELIGGRVRDHVPFSAYLFYKHAGGGGEGDDAREDVYGEALTDDAIVRQAQQMIDEYGFKSIKLKAGVLDPDVEIGAMRALREHFGPDVPLRIDPNGAWSVDMSVHVGSELAGTLEYLEDPAIGIDGMAEVRKKLLARGIDMPLATNMCVVGFDDVMEAVAKDAVQVILGDHHYWGGVRSVVELGRICSTFNLGLSMHSNSHLGISLMAMTHLGAASPTLTYDADTHYPWLHAADDVVVGGKIEFVDGGVPVPTTPGLGIEVDRDALRRGRERFERIPYRDRDDVGYMRKAVDPTWEKLLPRW